MLQAVSNALKLPDLRRKIFFTLGILVLYRLAAHVPVPGVNAEALRQVFQQNQLLGLLDMFSGGAMSNFSVMAMGVYPFITAQIVLQSCNRSRSRGDGQRGRGRPPADEPLHSPVTIRWPSQAIGQTPSVPVHGRGPDRALWL